MNAVHRFRKPPCEAPPVLPRLGLLILPAPRLLGREPNFEYSWLITSASIVEPDLPLAFSLLSDFLRTRSSLATNFLTACSSRFSRSKISRSAALSASFSAFRALAPCFLWKASLSTSSFSLNEAESSLLRNLNTFSIDVRETGEMVPTGRSEEHTSELQSQFHL